MQTVIIAGLGIPACSALFTGAITYLIFSYAQGEPPTTADLFGAILFGVLSLVVVLLGIRASKRHAGEAPRLARAAPILIVVGAIAGPIGTVLMLQDAFESARTSRDGYCREYLQERATESAMELCRTEAKTCDKEVRASETGRSYDALMRECIDRRVGALVLMGKLPDAPRPESDDPITPVYPTDVKEVPPLVERLCDVLHGLPKRRRAECCQREPGVVLTRECVRNLAGALADGSVVLTEADVNTCETAMKSAHEGCDWVGPNPPGVPAACLGIVRGTRKLNDVCRSSLECQHGLRCVGAGPTQRGRCGKPPSNGALCNTAVDTLAVYLRQDDFERRHPPCADGFCDRNRCVAKLPTNAPCKANDQCLVGRCAEGRCIDERTADEGEPCLGGDCIEGTRCVEGKCVEIKPIGADCTQHAECKAACIEGKCQMDCEEAPLLKKLSPPPALRKDTPESRTP